MSKCRYDLSEDCHNKKDCLACILDKISTEIAQYEADCMFADTSKECKECDRVMFGTIYRIIDKHKKKSEGQA